MIHRTTSTWFLLTMLLRASQLSESIAITACPRGKPASFARQPMQQSPQNTTDTHHVEPQGLGLEQGGFGLSINNTTLLLANKTTVLPTFQIHTITLQTNDGAKPLFNSFLIRLEGKHNRMDQALSAHSNSHAQVAKQCISSSNPKVWGLTHETNGNATTLRQHHQTFDLYFEKPEEGMTLDITLQGQGSLFHSQFVIDAVDQRHPPFSAFLGQQRRLNDTGGGTPTTPAPSDAPSSSPLEPTDFPSSQPTLIPTTLPSLVPSFAPSSVPSVHPTSAPSSFPSISPSDGPSLEPSPLPSVAPSGTPSFVPSTRPSFVPSTRPSFAPSTEPSFVPSSRPSDTVSTSPSSSPSLTPSLRPSGAPSLRPSPGPSGSPSLLPTNSPSLRPSFLQPTTSPSTMQPTRAPTEGTLVTGEIQAQLTLRGIEELDAVAQLSFEATMDGFFPAVYPSTLGRHVLRRQLLAEGVVQVKTQTTITSQNPADNTNTITYDQTISYTTYDRSVTLGSVASQPFEDPQLNEQFRDRLKSSHDAFVALPNESIAAPVITHTSENSDDDDGGGTFGLGIIVGIGVGGTALLSLFVLVFFRKSLSQKGGSHSATHDDDAAAATTTDGPPDTQKSSRASEPSLGYGDQSVSTLEYDYAKAYGGFAGAGEQSIVSEAVGTLGDDTRDHQNEMMGSGRALGSSQFCDEPPMVKEEIFEINAPSGKLGVVIDTPDDGPPVVHAVKDSSVLVDQVQVGDKLLKVDGEVVQHMTAVRVSKLISRKSAQSCRKFTMLRRIVVDEQQVNQS